MKMKNVLIALVAVAMMPLVAVAQVSAWGPDERPTYTMASPATKPVFNSITDNAAIGDERDFVRIAELGTEDAFTSELILEPNKEYIVMIYYHNDASATFNDAAHNYSGVAQNVRVASFFPAKLAKGERGKIDGVISASNTDPLKVWDEAYIMAREGVRISYIPDTATIRNQNTTNGSKLSTELFSSAGTYIGSAKLNGLVPGCDAYVGEVFYRLKTEALPVEEAPAAPVVKEMPKTGPAEIALAAAVIIAVGAGVVYWRKTSREVQKATKAAKGKTAKKPAKSGAKKKPAKRK